MVEFICWHPTPLLLPGKSHGPRSLVGYSLWGREESDTTERLHFHFSLSCIGERNGNPLQCSCLENPRDRGAWWAAVSGVAQSWTRLTRLSSSRVYMLMLLSQITPPSSSHPVSQKNFKLNEDLGAISWAFWHLCIWNGSCRKPCIYFRLVLFSFLFKMLFFFFFF